MQSGSERFLVAVRSVSLVSQQSICSPPDERAMFINDTIPIHYSWVSMTDMPVLIIYVGFEADFITQVPK